MTGSFKTCPLCQTKWETRDDFLDDASLEIIGYVANFKKLELGLFYFTHKKEGCFTTLTIKAKEFISMYKGKRYEERKNRKEECPSYCLDKDSLDRCDAFCECAFNREVIQLIKKRQQG